MTSQFNIYDTPISGLRLLERSHVGDNRGYLERMFCTEELQALIAGKIITQINHTLTLRCGTVRGMHFQHPPHAETRFVSCTKGAVFDVAVDLRRGSPTFLNWHGETLSAENLRTLIIPEGFAHGFQTLVDDCEMIYFHTDFYAPEAEAAINAKDPRIGIKWPVDITEISDRDRNHSLLTSEYKGVEL